MRSVLGSSSFVSCAAAMVLLGGCAAFRVGDLPDVDSLAPLPAGAATPSAAFKVTAGVDMGGERESPESVRALHAQEFAEVLRESGYFASVAESGQGEVQVDARIVNSGSPAAAVGGMICGLSLLSIPCWATDHYGVKARVVVAGRGERTYELKTAMRTFIWLPLIVAMPFAWPGSVGKATRKNLWRNLILRMQEDGLLQAPGTPGAGALLQVRLLAVA